MEKMSKLKKLFTLVNEVKLEKQKSKDQGLFSYVPDSILNHKANKVRPKSSKDRDSMKKRRGTGDNSN